MRTEPRGPAALEPVTGRTGRAQAGLMHTQAANLYRIEDLADSRRTNHLADADLRALQTGGKWISTFVALPNQDLGRDGPVCPFVPGGLERGTIWLAPEQVDNLSTASVVRLLDQY